MISRTDSHSANSSARLAGIVTIAMIPLSYSSTPPHPVSKANCSWLNGVVIRSVNDTGSSWFFPTNFLSACRPLHPGSSRSASCQHPECCGSCERPAFGSFHGDGGGNFMTANWSSFNMLSRRRSPPNGLGLIGKPNDLISNRNDTVQPGACVYNALQIKALWRIAYGGLAIPAASTNTATARWLEAK